ncbi:E3 ubiquitin-protein ligase PUB23-like [Curcuma longa]|uniref:E3 ubiquitin-protein ligase PUB23-like n=1 Tax=Curcuma longa TaxID=136217 RepID=UPI003D9DE460
MNVFDHGRNGIPPFFLCPISLEIMEDPVTVATGVSYDRRSISRWLAEHDTCPVTNQRLTDLTLTPNATLLRLIRSWSTTTTNAAFVSFPELSEILRDLRDQSVRSDVKLRALKKIRTLLLRGADGGCVDTLLSMEEAGATSLVASLLISKPSSPLEITDDFNVLIDEAAVTLHLLEPSSETLKVVSERNDGELIASLGSLLRRGSYQGRVGAALLLSSIFEVVGEEFKSRLPSDVIEAAVEVLKDQNASHRTTMALLAVLLEVLPRGNNRWKAVETGVVDVMVELLVEEGAVDKRKCEAMLAVLEVVCGMAEGRAELVAHPAGLAAVAARLMGVSSAVTERAVRVLGLVCRNCGGDAVAEELMQVGGVERLCAMVQVEGNRRTRETAKKILAMHMKKWSKSPCFPSYCLP